MENINQHFFINQALLEVPEKKDYTSYTNLSSNELIHYQLKLLHAEFLSSLGNNCLRKYPTHKSARTDLGDLLQVCPEKIVLSPGSDYAINLMMQCLTKINKIVILQHLEYYNYERYGLLNNCQPIIVEFKEKKYSDNMLLLKQEVRQYSRSVVILSNPNGYLGQTFTLEEMRSLAMICAEQEHLFIIDEAYIQFANFNHLTLLANFENIIILHTFSKSHAAAGLRLAAIITNSNIAYYLRKFGLENCLNYPALQYCQFMKQQTLCFQEIIKDILTEREHIILWCQQQFPYWDSYLTQTNFICMDIKNNKQLINLVEFFHKYQVIIKSFKLSNKVDTLVRITIGDHAICQLIKTILTAWINTQKISP